MRNNKDKGFEVFFKRFPKPLRYIFLCFFFLSIQFYSPPYFFGVWNSFGVQKKSTSKLKSEPLFQSEINPIHASLSKIGDSSHIEWIGRNHWSYKIKKLGQRKISITLPPLSKETVMKLMHWKDDLIQKIKVKKSNIENTHKVIFYFKKDEVKVFDYLVNRSSLLITDFYTEARKNERTSKKKKASLKGRGKKISVKRDLKKNQYRKLNTKLRKNLTQKKKKEKKKKSLLSESTSQLKGKFNKKKSVGDRSPAGGEFLRVSEDEKSIDFSFLINDDSKDESLTPSELSLRRGVFDGSDPNFERFSIKDYEIKEESIIESRKNIYIKFPLLHMKMSRLSELLKNSPEYRIKKTKTQENAETRFLLKLFKKKKFFSFLKFYNYFIRNHSKSHYDEIVRNLAMEVYFKLWKKNGSKRDYNDFKSLVRYLMKNYPQSPLTRRSELIVAYSALENQDALEAIQNFQEFIKKNPHSVLLNELKQSLAEAFLIIDKYADALAVYEGMKKDMVKNKKQTKTQIKSAYFIGDVYLRQEKYKKAVLEYKKALISYPEYKYVFPNVFYNVAESLFWLGHYKESLSYYTNYLKYFPSHPHGSYAMTRVGEILDILGAKDEKVKGVFMESAFRFKNSPGADIAKIRMASRNMEEMKEKEVKKALEEVNKISKRSKLPRISEFASLMIADGLYRRKDYEGSLRYLIDFYYKNPTTATFTPFKKRILRNISNLIKRSLDKGKFIESIEIFKTYDTNWLKDADRFDLPFFLARSYELAGASEAARKIYKKTFSNLKKIEGSWEEKERRVNEHLPSQNLVRLRLASVAVKQRRYGEAYHYLMDITNDEFLRDPERVEKVELASIIANERGEKEKSEAYLQTLTKTWKGKLNLLSKTYLNLARVQKDLKKFLLSEQSLNKLMKLLQKRKKSEAKNPQELSKISDLRFKALQIKGDVLSKQKKNIAAVEVYTNLIEEFENKKPVGSIRYKIGKILFNKGDSKGAEEIWRQLDPEEHSMYLNLAREQIDHFEWRKDYNQYLKKIHSPIILEALSQNDILKNERSKRKGRNLN